MRIWWGMEIKILKLSKIYVDTDFETIFYSWHWVFRYLLIRDLYTIHTWQNNERSITKGSNIIIGIMLLPCLSLYSDCVIVCFNVIYLSWETWSPSFEVRLNSSTQEVLFYILYVWNIYLFIEVERNLTKSQPIIMPRISSLAVPRGNYANGHTSIKHHKHTRSNDLLIMEPTVTQVQCLSI